MKHTALKNETTENESPSSLKKSLEKGIRLTQKELLRLENKTPKLALERIYK